MLGHERVVVGACLTPDCVIASGLRIYPLTFGPDDPPATMATG